MSIILKHLFRNITAKKGRSLMVLLSLGIAAFVGTIILSLGDGMDDMIAGMMRGLVGDVQISASPMNPTRTSEIVLPEGVTAAYTNSVTVSRNFHQPSNFKYVTQRTLPLTGVNVDEAYKIGYINKAYEIADQEVIMNQDAADELHYQVGDEIVVYDYNDEPVKLKISDVVTDKGFLLKIRQ